MPSRRARQQVPPAACAGGGGPLVCASGQHCTGRQPQLTSKRTLRPWPVAAGEAAPEGKFFGNFPYPYMNGLLHLGHAFSLSKVRRVGDCEQSCDGLSCVGTQRHAAAVYTCDESPRRLMADVGGCGRGATVGALSRCCSGAWPGWRNLWRYAILSSGGGTQAAAGQRACTASSASWSRCATLASLGAHGRLRAHPLHLRSWSLRRPTTACAAAACCSPRASTARACPSRWEAASG